MTEPPTPDDDGDRRLENAVLLGVFIAVVAGGAWLLMSMADMRKGLDCAAQGRRNCGTIEVPDRSR